MCPRVEQRGVYMASHKKMHPVLPTLRPYERLTTYIAATLHKEIPAATDAGEAHDVAHPVTSAATCNGSTRTPLRRHSRLRLHEYESHDS